jgi:protein phosphatase methylesterase 1
MIGHMQGKFQMEVVPGVGHMIQEDDPTKLAGILVDFWKRNEKVLVGVKKVGES